MVATSGARLLEADALDALRTRLMPIASIITPNLPEAELLLGTRIANRDAMHAACVQLRDRGARAVLLKGGHLADRGDVTDLFCDASGTRVFTHPRLPGEAHGTGCTLASAVAANLCRGRALAEACEAAGDYVHRALSRGYRPGRGDVLVLDHFGAAAHG